MKKFFIFLGGIITGIILTIFVLFMMYSANQQGRRGLTLFEEKGECITKEKLHVFQVLEPNVELANEVKLGGGIVVLLMNDNNKYYYDDEIITIPQKKCAKQLGTYQYETKDHNWKTVPVVGIDRRGWPGGNLF